MGKDNSPSNISNTYPQKGNSIVINELYLFGDVGMSWWDDYFTAKEVSDALQDLPAGSEGLDVWINTFGGDVGEGLSIMNLIRSYNKKQTAMNSQFKTRTLVSGFAYSAGTLLMMSSDIRVMLPGSKAMVHNPIGGSYGNYKDFEKMAVQYKEYASYYAGLYAQISGKKSEEWQTLMDDETFFTSIEAVKVGLATDEESLPAPATKEEARGEKTGKSKLVAPSSVYKENKDVLDKVCRSGRGAYAQAMTVGRQKREKNISVKQPISADQLLREMTYATMCAEWGIKE